MHHWLAMAIPQLNLLLKFPDKCSLDVLPYIDLIVNWLRSLIVSILTNPWIDNLPAVPFLMAE